MPDYSLSHVSDRDLIRDLASLVEQERAHSEAVRACIAEFGARGLNLPESVVLTPEEALTSHERFVVAIDQDTYDQLRYAQALLRDQGLSGDVAEVLELGLKALIAEAMED